MSPRRNERSPFAAGSTYRAARAARSAKSSVRDSGATPCGPMRCSWASSPSTPRLSSPSIHGWSESGTSGYAPERRLSRQPKARAIQYASSPRRAGASGSRLIRSAGGRAPKRASRSMSGRSAVRRCRGSTVQLRVNEPSSVFPLA
jgi:hypothetical protein